MNMEEKIKALEAQKIMIEKRKERNDKINKAIIMAKIIKSNDFRLIREEIEKEIEKIKYQNILGLKNEILDEQKGIVVGMESVLSMFDDIVKLAKQPRLDPETGEPEKK